LRPSQTLPLVDQGRVAILGGQLGQIEAVGLGVFTASGLAGRQSGLRLFHLTQRMSAFIGADIPRPGCRSENQKE
jgi:hypothetical protein